MGKMTLSKLQKEQYKEIVRRFDNTEIIILDYAEYARLKETLGILEMLEYVCRFELSSNHGFKRLGNFEDFDKWHKDKEREERKLSLREWIIGIVGALIGLIPFVVTTVVPWIVSLFTSN